jgi:hypothetical protein
MKRIATAALLASIVGSALAAGASADQQYTPGFEPGRTYEQTQVDRALPNVKDPVIERPASAGSSAIDENFSGFEPGRTYEQTQVDRALPNVKDPVQTTQVAGPASAGATAPRAFGPGTYGPGTDSRLATGPWANDWNFIAPAN